MPDADLILKNARVITADPARPAGEMVAVRGDRISLVTDNGGVESVRGRKTRIIDCQGRTVAPGFNDAHCHIFSFLRKQLSLDLSPLAVKSVEDIKAAISRKVENTPPGEWITGSDYNEFYLAEKRHPNRWDIDQAAPDHPVVISHSSLHGCVLNSRALSLAGITGETEEPPGGRIDRDTENGEPSGLLFEMLGFIRSKVMPPLSEAELDSGIWLADKHYLSQGITSLQDATVTNDINRWRQFNRFKETGRLKSRLSVMSGMDSLEQFREAG
ncbi:MAG: amidohydrolase family protein, partial [Dehalococcoidales bacterium]